MPVRFPIALLLQGSLLVLLFGLPTGCTHTRSLDVTSPEDRTAFNARLAAEVARIAFEDGRIVEGRSVHVAPTLTTWIPRNDGTRRSAPTAEIVSISIVSRGLGALEGGGIGFVVGGGIGGLAGSGDSSGADEIDVLEPGEAALGVGLIGLAIGAFIGIGRGSRDVYQVQSVSPSDSTRRLSGSTSVRQTPTAGQHPRGSVED